MRTARKRTLVALLTAIATLFPAAAGPPSLESVRAHLARDEHEQALAEARALLARAEADQGRDSLQAAEALEGIARAMAGGRLGEREERLAAAERALALRQRWLDAGDPALAFGHYVVGLVYYLADEPQEALPHFERALAMAETAYGALDAQLEWYVREDGAALFATGRYAEALEAFERLDVISRSTHGKGHPGTVPALFNLALVHDVLGEIDEAERLYLDALAILERQQPPDFERLAWTLEAHSGLLARQGRLGPGLAECERAIELRRLHLGSASPELAQSLVVHGRMLWLVGDYEKARVQLEASIAIERGRKATRVLYSAYLNLATLSRLEGDLVAARAALDEARRAGSASLTEDHSVWFGYHMERGEVLGLLGERAAARAQYARALEIGRATIGERHYDYGTTLASLGRLDLRDGDAATAREHIEGALEIFEGQLGRQHPLYVEVEEALGGVYNALDLRGPAFARSLAAERTRRDLERATLAVLPERQALAQANRPRAGRDLAIVLALAADAPADRKTAAYDALIRSRAVVFDEIAARQRLFHSSADAGAGAAFDRLSDAKSRLAGLFVRGPDGDPTGYANRVRTARDTIDSIERELAEGSASYRVRLADREFGIDELRRALPQHSACLSYVRNERPSGRPGERVVGYAAMVQRAGAPVPVLIDLGPAIEIENAVARWRAVLEPARVVGPGAEAGYRISAAELRRRVWDPVAAHLAGIDTLFVVPDSSLQLVSLAALPAGDTSYLLEGGPTFHYLTAERDLGRGTDSVKGTGLLALGDPAFEDPGALAVAVAVETYRGDAPQCSSFDSARFGPLPATADEVEAVRSIWNEGAGAGAPKLLVGRFATELEFKRQAPGKQVLHLATHGFFLGEECGAPGPYRGIGGVSARRETAPPVRNEGSLSPLLLSGLALAGANRRGTAVHGAEDGILTAEEVSALDLTGVRVAVLSACRTGTGQVSSGEGVFGLRRAFLLAGAASVVTNLWDVEDRAGQAWIEAFYREHLRQGRTLPEAVRRASRTVLGARRTAGLATHPFYWAGWLAVGNPD